MKNLPVAGSFNITAVYGQRGPYWKDGHKGLDFVAKDKRIFSTCDGVVRVVDYDANGWGQYVSIGDNEGRRHIFCHLVRGSVTVKPGDKVNRSTVIGTMGETGNVTGVHLHYQLQIGDSVVNPCDFLGLPNTIGFYTPVFNDYNQFPEWAADAIHNARERGLMNGDDQGNFRPNDPVTRAEMAVILDRLK